MAMISVCMTTYNGAKYLGQQVDSILCQLSASDELIVSDDGSLDATISILQSYNDPRIRIVNHHKEPQKHTFGYTSANINNALCHAVGDYVFLADQDDVWLPNKVELMVGRLQACDMILSDCSFVDASLQVLVKSKFAFEGVKIGVMRNLYKCKYLGSSMAFRKELLRYLLPIPKNVPHDLWIGLVGGRMGRFELLDTPTMLYRRHDQNVSATNNDLLDKQSPSATTQMAKNENSLSFQLAYRLTTLLAFFRFIVAKR